MRSPGTVAATFIAFASEAQEDAPSLQLLDPNGRALGRALPLYFGEAAILKPPLGTRAVMGTSINPVCCSYVSSEGRRMRHTSSTFGLECAELAMLQKVCCQVF